MRHAAKRGSSTVWLVLLLAASAAAQDLPPDFDDTFALTSLNPVLALTSDAVVRLDWQRFDVAGPGRAGPRLPCGGP